jgi:membrane-bound ClpP family serine protease
MDVDIRFPIGLLFTILGIILLLFGVITTGNQELYACSLGKNVNFWTGLLMIVFGGLMLTFSLLTKNLKNKS